MDCEAVEERIVGWLKHRLNDAGLEGFVVGVSGGVDSAVVSTLCARTDRPVHVLSLPIGCMSDGDKRAERHLDWLDEQHENVHIQTVSMDYAADGFDTVLENMEYEGIEEDGLVQANVYSRLRMTALYAVANHQNSLVVGTGNKVEDGGVGFFTKHGDGGVDISPIGDLLKTEVWELAEYLAIDEDIVDAKPTDGLWDDGRSDEDQLGMSYEEIEKYMKWHKNDKDPFELIDTDERAKYEKFLDLHHSTRHKMTMPPICDLDEVK